MTRLGMTLLAAAALALATLGAPAQASPTASDWAHCEALRQGFAAPCAASDASCLLRAQDAHTACRSQLLALHARPDASARAARMRALALRRICAPGAPPPPARFQPEATDHLLCFSPDSLTPPPEAADRVLALAKQAPGRRWVLAGFHPQGTTEYRLAVGLRLAQAVQSALVAAGMPVQATEVVAVLQPPGSGAGVLLRVTCPPPAMPIIRRAARGDVREHTSLVWAGTSG